jgi:glutathione S-transferase
MKLYTCPAKTIGGTVPVITHPCGRAAHALDEAGLTYEVETVGGFKALPITRRGKRDEIRRLTGQEDVPVLVLEDGDTVVGTKAIVAWAAERG